MAKTDARGFTTMYKYDWRGLNRKIIDTVTVYDETSDAYVQKNSITLNWYDYAGRKIGDVSPNNYRESMEAVTFPYLAPSNICSNYNYYTYDEFGRITRSGFDGEEYIFNSTNSTWSASILDTYKQYTYDNNNNLLTETDQESDVTENEYTPQGKLLSKLDHENKQRYLPFTVKYEYDTLGRVITEKKVKSDTTQEQAEIAAQITAGTLPAGSTIDESSAVGAIVTYGYDNVLEGSIIKANKVTKTVNLTDNNGVVEKSTYDLKGKLIEYTSCKGGTEYTSTYEYNNFGKLSKAVEPYEVDGTLTSTQKIMQYNSLGNMVYVQNMMNTLTDTTDDICDLYSYNVVSSKVETQCQQRYNGNEAITTHASYDKNGNTVSTTDGNSVQTTYQYDELDRMKFSTVTAGGVVHDTTYDYDLNGNLIRTVNWRDNANKYKYDALNRLYEKKDPMNVAYEKLEYNARNLQDKSYDAYNRLTEYDYDCNGRLVSTTDPELHVASQEYDNMGNVRVKCDGEENELKYEYDILGRLEHVYNDESATTPMSSYTYYIDGTLKEQNLGGYVTTYYYNASGKLKMVCDPNGIGVSSKTETYEYTPTGELMEKLDRNGKNTTYEYDCHGRMISQFTGDSSTYVQIRVPNESTDMGYDGNGNLKKIIVETKENGVLKSRVTTQRIYDELNRVKTKTEISVDANNNTIVMGPVTYNYDIITGVNAGEVKEQSIYPGSNSVDKVYDAAGRLKTVTSDGQTTVYDYYDDGRRESITYNDNFRQVYTYYDDGLLDTLTNQAKDDQGVFAESEYYKYCYDGAHNMTQKQERLGGPTEPTKTTSYGYDCMNRLKNIYEPDINTAQRTIAYTYDSRGNRDTEIETITATNEVTYTKYEYTDNNRIQYVTKREDDQYGNIIQKRLYLHDSNGNLKNVYDITNGPSTITTNTYTLLNQLKTTVTTGINQQMENTYNAEGKRVAKTVGGTTARYFYEYDNVAFEYTNSGTISAFNVIGTNLISRETGTDKVYYFYNGHADVTALLDATTKSIRSQYKYDEFGNITSETYYDSTGEETIDENEIIKSQILYAGYQYDEESKYYNLQARYYDPQTARFLQQDTYMGSVNDPLSLNLYAYCHNEPMMYVDPTGYAAAKTAADLLYDVLNQKEVYEEEQEGRDKLNWWNPKKYVRTKAQEDAAGKASKDRKLILETKEYKNNSQFKEAYDKYLKKSNGGTGEDVSSLIAILTYSQKVGPSYPDASTGEANNSSSNSSSKGTGNQVFKGESWLALAEGNIPYIYSTKDSNHNPWTGSFNSSADLTFGIGHSIKTANEFNIIKNFIATHTAKEIADEVQRYLQNDLAAAVETVNDFSKNNNVTLKQNQFDAIVALVFNVPASLSSGSDLAEALTTYGFNKQKIIDGFTYTKFQGSRIDGLVTRRNNELNLFFNADYNHYYDTKQKVINAGIAYIPYL